MKTPPAPRVRDAIARVFIIAYREDTRRLEETLRAEGLEVIVQRQAGGESLKNVSPNLRCLINHADAWKKAADLDGLSLFVETDFAPCLGFGGLPLPFDPALHGPRSWAYLYAGGPRIYERLESGHLLAHACSTVAYCMPPEVARMGLAYVEQLRSRHPDWSIYHPFDTELQWHLMGMGARAFVPLRQLGEHGGKPNPEHFAIGMGASLFRRLLARLGIGLNHYADVLAGPLAFLPLYAGESRIRYLLTRIEGRAFGWARFLAGKTVSSLASPPRCSRIALYRTSLLRLIF